MMSILEIIHANFPLKNKKDNSSVFYSYIRFSTLYNDNLYQTDFISNQHNISIHYLHYKMFLNVYF